MHAYGSMQPTVSQHGKSCAKAWKASVELVRGPYPRFSGQKLCAFSLPNPCLYISPVGVVIFAKEYDLLERLIIKLFIASHSLVFASCRSLLSPPTFGKRCCLSCVAWLLASGALSRRCGPSTLLQRHVKRRSSWMSRAMSHPCQKVAQG